MPDPEIPSYRDLLYPTLRAIDDLGGSATKQEINEKVIELQAITEDQLAVTYPDDAIAKGSKVLHRAAFARSSMKGAGALDNSKRGVWALNDRGRTLLAAGDEAARDADSQMRKELRKRRKRREPTEPERVTAQEPDEDEADEATAYDGTGEWTADLLEVLHEIPPSAFERLCGRLLREEGFARVRVTGGPNDEGIDGTGILEMGLISFPVYFQCKRYRGQVGPRHVRDLRGAMTGRGEKGILITTASFSQAAEAEATRDGAPPVDLIDGPELCELLKRHSLGLEVEMVEQVTIDPTFFDSL